MTIRSFQGKTPVLGSNVFIDDSAVVLGDVVMGADCSVWPCTVIRGDVHEIRIGERTNIQDGSVLHNTHISAHNPQGFPLHIGNDVTVGHNVTLHGCTIHDCVLIGMGAIVMDGAVIESEVLLAAGAMVTPGSHLESGFLYMGSPARQARPLTEEERKFFLYSSNIYVNLKDKHLEEI